MNLYQIRNATIIIETETACLLVDPMLTDKSVLPPFSFFRSKARKNPTVALPENAPALLARVTHCLITHRHPDHLDAAGVAFLHERAIPVYCGTADAAKLRGKGLNVAAALTPWEEVPFLQGTLTGIPGVHGYGLVAKLVGAVTGFHLELPGQPSLYLSSDTVYTDHVARTLRDKKPDVSVLAAGIARFDLLQPLLMNASDIVRFVRNAPGRVFANHMEAVNHCTLNRAGLATLLAEEQLTDRVDIPLDGTCVAYAPPPR